ncbi:MAG: carbohydrate-binding domain-containing protein, partial [Planctomycetota bacterium]|jgi:hypothetical protein
VEFLREASYEFTVTARGTPAQGEYPNVRMLLDGEVIGEQQLRGGGWQDLTFRAAAGEGVRRVAVAFTNDLWLPDKGEDRNLWVRRVRIRLAAPAEAP